MAAKGDKKKKIISLIIVQVVLWLFWQVAFPFLKRTGEIKAEAAKLDKEIKEIQLDLKTYTSDWDVEMKNREDRLLHEIPNTLDSGEVLRYFVSEYEEKNPSVRFLSVLPQSLATSGVGADPEKPDVKARFARYVVAAQMPQNLIITYLQHIDKYAGAFLYDSFELNIIDSNKGLLRANVTYDLYVGPKEWMMPTGAPSPTRVVAAELPTSSKSNSNWFGALSNSEHEKDKRVGSSVSEVRETGSQDSYERSPRFKISHIIGESIVINESLFEEGDFVGGWKIARVDQVAKTVLLRKGEQNYKVTVR
ncbi:MAG: hypothetical protein HY537_08800 [Deltaproteobacteria bacterium]|nr:hypothetical protein [Deltaproteobacteria bacterium]